MTLNLLVLGKTGQLARALQRETERQSHNAVFLSRGICDLTATPSDIKAILASQERPDAIIIAAAFTAVDSAEENPDTAFAVNSTAPRVIAEYCLQEDLPLIHISTDYVFDGKSRSPYKPNSIANPINNYGKSKLAGEASITESGCRSAILRTSWVFDGEGDNFLTTMLRLAQRRDQLNIVADQIGRPTYAGHLAQAVLHVAKHLVDGKPVQQNIFHVTGSGKPTSWAGFAKTIFAEDRENVGEVNVMEIPSSEYSTKAARPEYAVLDLTAFEEAFAYTLPAWIDGVKQALNERSDT